MGQSIGSLIQGRERENDNQIKIVAGSNPAILHQLTIYEFFKELDHQIDQFNKAKRRAAMAKNKKK